MDHREAEEIERTPDFIMAGNSVTVNVLNSYFGSQVA